MAVKYYTGRAGIVPGQVTVLVVSDTPTEIIGIAVGTRTELYTIPAGTLTVEEIAANFYAQLVASSALEFQELSYAYTAGTDTITITHTNPVESFTVTAAGTALAVTVTVVTATTGPGDISNADNWNGAALPVAADDLVFDLPDTPVYLGLDYFAAIDLASITVTNRHNGGIGLPRFRRSGVGGYLEYRDRYLEVDTVTRFIIDDSSAGENAPGPNICAIFAGGGSSTAIIKCNNGQLNDDEPPVLLGFHGSSNVVHLTRGVIGVVTDALASITGVCATVNVGRDGADGEVPECHITATVTTLNNYSGITTANLATTLTMGRQAVRHEQTGGNLTATVRNGELVYRTAGTLTVTADGAGAVVNCERSTEAKTIHSSSTFRNGAALLDGNGTTSGSTASFDGPSARASRMKDNVSVSL